MDSFITTPSSSDVDVLIEKFKLAIGNELENQDDDNTRRLTITSTVNPMDSQVSSQDIDVQLNDLEALIKKLQDEIVEMSKNADKEVEYLPLNIDDSYDVHKDLSSETIILDKPEDSETLRNKLKREDTRKDNNIFDADQFSHIYPVLINDVVLPIKRTPTDKNIDNENNSETLSTKEDAIDIWNDVPKPQDNLETLISDLQAEIIEKMETLKDVTKKESHNIPDKNFESNN